MTATARDPYAPPRNPSDDAPASPWLVVAGACVASMAVASLTGLVPVPEDTAASVVLNLLSLLVDTTVGVAVAWWLLRWPLRPFRFIALAVAGTVPAPRWLAEHPGPFRRRDAVLTPVLWMVLHTDEE